MRGLTRVVDRAPVPMAPRAYGQGLHLNGPQLGAPVSALGATGRSGTLFAIVDATSTAVAELEWGLWRKPARPGGERSPVLTHAALDVWENPNPHTTRYELVEAGQQHQDLVGETVLIVGRPDFSKVPIELWGVRPDRIEPVPHPQDFLTGWIYTSPDGERIPLGLDEVIFMRRPNPMDPYRGLGPVQSVLVDLDADRYSAEWNRNFFRNSAEPGGIVELPEALDDDQFREFQQRWAEQHQGVARAHRIGLLENGAKWVDRKYTMRDMQFTELRNVSREVLREAFRMSKTMLGLTEDVNRATAEAAEYVFTKHLVKQRANRWKQAINHDFLPLFGDTVKGLEFDYDLVVPTDEVAEAAATASRTASAVQLIGAGFDPTEVLAALDLPNMSITIKPEADAVPEGDPKAKQRDIVEAVQKIYLGVDTVITWEEAREILNGYGANLNLSVPAPEKAPAPAPFGAPGAKPAEPAPPGNRVMNALPDQSNAPEGGPPPDDQHDLQEHQADWEAALAALIGVWVGVRALQAADLVDQVRTIMTRGDYRSLVGLKAGDHGARVHLWDALKALWVKTAAAETKQLHGMGHTDVTAPEPPDALEERAHMLADLLTNDLSQSASRTAVNAASPDVPAEDVADQVRDHLGWLVDPATQLGGALTQAQGEARLETMKLGPSPAYYSSAILDRATCVNCRATDGKWLGNDASTVHLTFPNGQYVQCLGRERCRCQVVASYRGGSKADWYEKEPVEEIP